MDPLLSAPLVPFPAEEGKVLSPAAIKVELRQYIPDTPGHRLWARPIRALRSGLSGRGHGGS